MQVGQRPGGVDAAGFIEGTDGILPGVLFHQEQAQVVLQRGMVWVALHSALLKFGPQRLSEILAGLSAWMDEKGFASLADFRGRMSQQPWSDTSALTREGYVMLLDNYAAPAVSV